MNPQLQIVADTAKQCWQCSNHVLSGLCLQDDTYTESYISTIGVDFVSEARDSLGALRHTWSVWSL